MEMLKNEVRLEVTKELLDTYVPLGDGTRVTWGEMTVEHIDQRIAILIPTAVGTLEGISKLQQARDLITEAGVSNLNEWWEEKE